jgi:hypothetical protein
MSVLAIFLFICLNRLYIYLVAMDPFHNAYADTDLASLYNVTFIRNNSMKKMIGGKRNNPYKLLKEHFFAVVMLYKKNEA